MPCLQSKDPLVRLRQAMLWGPRKKPRHQGRLALIHADSQWISRHSHCTNNEYRLIDTLFLLVCARLHVHPYQQVHPKDGGVPCGSQEKVHCLKLCRYFPHLAFLGIAKATSLSEMEHCPPEPGQFDNSNGCTQALHLCSLP